MSSDDTIFSATKTAYSNKTLVQQTIAFSQIEGLNPEDTKAVNALHAEFMSSLFVLMKSGSVFDLNNPTLHAACDRIANAANGTFLLHGGEAVMQFRPDGIFVNRQLVKVGGRRYEHIEYVTSMWGAFGVGTLVVNSQTDGDTWLEVIKEFRRFAKGESEYSKIFDIQIPGIRILPPDGKEGVDGDGVEVSDRFNALRTYTICGLLAERLMERVLADKPAQLLEVKRPLAELTSAGMSCPDVLIALTLLKRNKGPLHTHLRNAACISIVMGVELGLPRGQLLNLAMAAVLHDVGRLYYPDGTGSAKELEYNRAQESIRRVALWPNQNSATRAVICNEVRQWAGSKKEYPYEVTTQAKIIAVARAFDRLTSPGKKNPALLPDEALRVILKEAGRRYDEAVVRLLVNAVGMYPIGSVVALSNGKTAIVVGISKNGDPALPRVKVIRDKNGKQVDGASVDLATVDSVRVVGCADAEEEAVNIPAFLLG